MANLVVTASLTLPMAESTTANMHASASAMIVGPDTTPPGRNIDGRKGKPEHRPAAIDRIGAHADVVRPRKVFANDRVEAGDADFGPHCTLLGCLKRRA